MGRTSSLVLVGALLLGRNADAQSFEALDQNTTTAYPNADGAQALDNVAIGASQAASDLMDFSWVRRWAAVGDSFTAGIGAGNVYSSSSGDRKCSRYDYSYPAILNRFFGPSVSSFTYSACSGANSQDIAGQIDQLPNGQLDLVVMTAGGNDLCLSDLIWDCILESLGSTETCQKTIAKSRNAIQTILFDNIVELLLKLDSKMVPGGVVVLGLYAQYFDTSTDDCEKRENWGFIYRVTGSALTAALRTQLNQLVQETNYVLKTAVQTVAQRGGLRMKLVDANWDPWVTDTGGRFCRPGSSPYTDDPVNSDVLFYKLDTAQFIPGIVKREDEARLLIGNADASNMTTEQRVAVVEEVYMQLTSKVYLTDAERGDVRAAVLASPPPAVAPAAEQAHPPACTKSWLGNVIAKLLPDGIGKIFHPNKKGHEAVASFVSEAAMEGRAQVLGTTSPACASTGPVVQCLGVGTQKYTSQQAAYPNIARFCASIAANPPPGADYFVKSQNFHEDTPDEVYMEMYIEAGVGGFDEHTCNVNLQMGLDKCDGDINGLPNPMGWKMGAAIHDGSHHYRIEPAKYGRPWPPPTSPRSSCEGWYKFFYDAYDVYGAGWAGWDFGQETLRPKADSCGAGSLTQWNFRYLDPPDSNGYEWHASFRTIIGTKGRCFDNNKVQAAAGGPGDAGCRGNG